MKKSLIAFTVILFLSGCSLRFFTTKPLTGQIPSTDKTVLEGTKLSAASRASTDGTYPVYQRLYDTTWYQTEKEIDDGKLEVETEFVFFDKDSSVFEIEVENGRVERPDADDYAVIRPVKEIKHISDNRKDPDDMNAWVVSKSDGEGELEYEAYWLYTDHILYITEGETPPVAEQLMTLVMDHLYEGKDTERFLLSTTPAPQP